ncbi:alpha/beta hydrolase [Comamonas sp. Tr-654]|uniref:alpha/beta fold hydrolase n=1 Tax=Comamonas sp. Tr-654 TaxID=2608341 RepID=UPI0014236B5E|nr:alpha/beta fold hydrolase [Comamonas sp. Tr-654]NIF82527.1 alpha/beta hydrolase [Comamonas sp. Tr-654]
MPITLVLLPGMDGTSILFEPFIAALGNRYPVSVVRYPAKDHSQTYAALHDFAEAQLPADGPIVLLGESFSGPIAISIAAANPVRVLGVILCCTFVRNPRPKLRWLKSLAWVPMPRPPLTIVNALLFGRFATSRLSALLRDALLQVHPSVMRARLREVASVDVRAQAAKLAMPVLYLKALNDQLVPRSAAAETQQWCRAMEVEVFDAPHCLLQVVPAEASDAVAHFIDRVIAT